MAKLKAAWVWLSRHWYIPLFVLGVVLGWMLSGGRRQKGTPLAQTKRELAAIEAARRAREKELELGTQKAKEWVEASYQAEIHALNMAQKSEAYGLRSDPAKLAAYLVRAGSR